MIYNADNHLNNIVSFLGPLHISLNARENVVLKFHGVFADLYAFLFHGKKRLAKKPKPWRISFLLEVLYGGWSIVRDEILGAFAHCKDIEFLTLVNLLDNYCTSHWYYAFILLYLRTKWLIFTMTPCCAVG